MIFSVITAMALQPGILASSLLNDRSFGIRQNSTIKLGSIATSTSILKASASNVSVPLGNRTVAQLFEEVFLAQGSNSSIHNEPFDKRMFYDYHNGNLLSTTWTINTISYNLSIIGSISASVDVGRYQFLNGTSINVASLDDIWGDLVSPHHRGAQLAYHTLTVARNVQNKAIDLVNNYILCGQNPAATRVLLARVAARYRDAFWTVLIVKGATQFSIAYLLNHFQHSEESITTSQVILAASAITFLATLSGGIIDRLQDKQRLFSGIEAFLIRAFLALAQTTLNSAGKLFRNSCLAESTLDTALSRIAVYIDQKMDETKYYNFHEIDTSSDDELPDPNPERLPGVGNI